MMRVPRVIATAVMAVFLTAAFLPALPASAAYPISRGQQISISKTGLGNAPLSVKSAFVEEAGLPFKISIFGLSYTVDTGGIMLDLSQVTAGSYVNITGTLDANDGTLIHAASVQVATTPPGDENPGTPGSVTGPCASGGQDSEQGGIVEIFGEPVIGLVRQAMGCASIWTFRAPGSVATGLPPDRVTINQQFLWYVWYYGWAMRAGTEAQKTDARAKLVRFFDVQAEHGHYTNANGGTELLNASHYQIWSHAAASARFLAVHHNDATLLRATGRWWRAEKALWDELQQNGSVRAPGGRFSEGGSPVSQLRDTVYALLSGRPLFVNPGEGTGGPGGPGVPTSNWWNQYYNVSAWTVRNLLAMGDDLGGATKATKSDIPKLPYVMCLYKRGSDYVYSFPRMVRTTHPVFWVARIGGVESISAYHESFAPLEVSEIPAPALPDSTLTVLSGVVGTAADCPAPGLPGPGGGSGGTPPPADEPTPVPADSTRAHDLVSDLFRLRKNTKDAGFSKNPSDKPKILINLAQMQRKIIELFVEVKPFNLNDTNLDITQGIGELQAKFNAFNLVGISCSLPTSFVPFVRVSDSCKRGLERTSGEFNTTLDKIKRGLPPPSAGSGEGTSGGDGLPPAGPFDA